MANIEENSRKVLKDIEFRRPSEGSLLAEYQAAQDFALQADSVAWQIGSILIGGSLLFLSVLGSKDITPFIFYGGILLINIIMMCWLLFFQGQYQIKMFKLYRMREIERELGLKQNYYWEKGRSVNDPCQPGVYRTYGPGGKDLSLFLYIVISFGFVFFGFLKLYLTPYFPIIMWNELLIMSLAVPIITIIWYKKNAKEFKEYIDTNP